MNNRQPLFGFMVLNENPPNSYNLAILVTDQNGHPLECRFTDKMVVDEIKQILYGQTLRSFLALTGERLLNILDHKPSVVFVKEDTFLKLREKIDCPIVCLNPKNDNSSNVSSFEVNESFSTDRESVSALLNLFSAEIPLDEPFQRLEQILKVDRY